MRVKIKNGNGWYSDCVGISFDIEEKVSERFGVLLVVSEDAQDFGSKISRFIERADCEILPDEDSTALKALRARLTATEAALSAAGKVLLPIQWNGWNNDLQEIRNSEEYKKYAAAVARLQEMTE